MLILVALNPKVNSFFFYLSIQQNHQPCQTELTTKYTSKIHNTECISAHTWGIMTDRYLQRDIPSSLFPLFSEGMHISVKIKTSHHRCGKHEPAVEKTVGFPGVSHYPGPSTCGPATHIRAGGLILSAEQHLAIKLA